MRAVRVLVFLIVCVCGLKAQQPVVLDDEQARQLAIEHPEPVYPPIARATHVSGDVVMLLEIGVDGRVTRATILIGPLMMEASAVDAVSRWVFKPYEQEGQAVPVLAKVTLKFRLTDPVKHAPWEPVDEIDRAIMLAYLTRSQRCNEMMSKNIDTAKTAKVCRGAAAEADKFGSNKHFIERRSAYVLCAAALLANSEAKAALEYADKAVAVVAQGHDDVSGWSRAYASRAQAEALTGDLPGADKDLDEAESAIRVVLGAVEGGAPSESYTLNLRALMKFHAQVLAVMGRKDQAMAKRDAAEKL